MEDFIVEIFTQSCSKKGEGAFTGNIVQDAGLRPVGVRAYAPEGMGTINTAAIIVPKQSKELAHILVTVDVSKQVQ